MRQDFLDAISAVSFLIGLANYEENLTQNDKADIMNRLDEQTKDILTNIEQSLNAQNEMLREILMEVKHETRETEDNSGDV